MEDMVDKTDFWEFPTFSNCLVHSIKHWETNTTLQLFTYEELKFTTDFDARTISELKTASLKVANGSLRTSLSTTYVTIRGIKVDTVLKRNDN